MREGFDASYTVTFTCTCGAESQELSEADDLLSHTICVLVLDGAVTLLFNLAGSALALYLDE